MSHTITQCPKCKTSFRIDEAQLDAAGGKVRCGFCMNVFPALDYVVRRSSGDAADEQGAGEPLSATDLAAFDDDDLVFDDSGAHGAATYAETEAAASASVLGAASTAKSAVAIEKVDEEWAKQLLTDDVPEPAAGVQGQQRQALDTPAPEVVAEPGVSDVSDSPKMASLDDLEDSLESRGVQQPLASQLRDEIGDFELPDAIATAQEPDFAVDQEYRPQAKPRKPRWPWLIGGVFLSAMLAVQYLYLNFDTLAMDGKYRPLLAKVCEQLRCELPVMKDLQQISTEKLVVRNHPDKAEALIVDVVITNQAEFSQAFPSLELTFSDLRGSAVATRQFLPAEYLQGELTGMRLMPARNPVHLELEIVDPGAEAVNYALKLVP